MIISREKVKNNLLEMGDNCFFQSLNDTRVKLWECDRTT